ncbi:MAG: NUDIX domain-containing protein [Anaerolineae bacterium]|nr:NUDIX domain-containing protein [Anaerolineae bacterium]
MPNWRDPALKLALAWWWLTRPRTVGVRGIVTDADGRVLFVRHSYGGRHWFLPGGGGRGHEAAETTLCREIREETGLEVRPTRLVGAYLYLGAHKRDHIFVFACERLGGDLRAVGGEIADAGWFWPLLLPEPLTPGLRTVLKTWQEGGCGYGYWPEA